MNDYIALTERYPNKSKPIQAARHWLKANAKHPKCKKGRNTFWHKDDLEAFAKQYKKSHYLIRAYLTRPMTCREFTYTMDKGGHFYSTQDAHKILARGIKAKIIIRTGAGTRKEPYTFALKGQNNEH